MSIDVMKMVWDKSQHKESNLVAMLALADMANSDGFCWPSHDTLAKRCRCNRRNMVYIIEKLEASGELYVEHNRGRNKSNRYIITINTTSAKLADLFVKYFDMPATEAVEEAKKHILKCATETDNVQQPAHLDNVQPTAHLNDDNVQQPAHLKPENVQSSALKCATACTRSVIEPSIEQHVLPLSEETKPKAQKRSASQARRTLSDESNQTTGGEVKKPTEHQQLFEKVCEIVGFDYKAIDDKCKGQVAQTVGILKDAAYTLEDLNRFGREIWVKDWRWEKHKQHPTLTQLRQEIGKLRAKNFQAIGTGSATWSKAFDNSDVPDYIKQMQAGK